MPEMSAQPPGVLGYGAPGAFGAPQQGGFGAPAPQQGGFGAPQQGGFGAPQQGGFGAPQQGGFGAPAPQQGGFGAPQQGGFGAPAPQQGGFGAPAPQQGGFGAPQQGGFGAPQQGGFGAPQQGGFGAPQPGGFNPMQPGGGMVPAGMAPTAGGIPFQPGMKSQTLAMDYNQAGFFCYLPCVGILALVFAITEPKEPARRWLRFHAFQALLVGVAGNVVINIVSSILGRIAAPLALVGTLASLGLLVYMVMIGLKAKNGETPKVPVLGEYAEKWA
ncbi:MAG: hypothetical protein U0325_30045 [Polyangiales bacterium]